MSSNNLIIKQSARFDTNSWSLINVTGDWVIIYYDVWFDYGNQVTYWHVDVSPNLFYGNTSIFYDQTYKITDFKVEDVAEWIYPLYFNFSSRSYQNQRYHKFII